VRLAVDVSAQHTDSKPIKCLTQVWLLFIEGPQIFLKIIYSNIGYLLGEKDFNCPNCESKFTSNSKVKRHVSLHCKFSKPIKLPAGDEND
jgi:hypothetical protein